MQKDMMRSVDTSWAILMFLGGVFVATLFVAAMRAALVPPRDTSTVGVYALPQDGTQPSTKKASSHVVIPPVLGDAVLGSQSVCGCPGCCSALNS